MYSTVNNQCCELVFNKTICCIFMIVKYGNVVYFGCLNICLIGLTMSLVFEKHRDLQPLSIFFLVITLLTDLTAGNNDFKS